jgi:hypothetical protein
VTDELAWKLTRLRKRSTFDRFCELTDARPLTIARRR